MIGLICFIVKIFGFISFGVLTLMLSQQFKLLGYDSKDLFLLTLFPLCVVIFNLEIDLVEYAWKNRYNINREEL